MIGLDLGKSFFQVHGRSGQEASQTAARPDRAFLRVSAARGDGNLRRRLGPGAERDELIPAQYVKPYVKSNKNDAADAEAICEARPEMRFAAVRDAQGMLPQDAEAVGQAAHSELHPRPMRGVRRDRAAEPRRREPVDQGHPGRRR